MSAAALYFAENNLMSQIAIQVYAFISKETDIYATIKNGIKKNSNQNI
jgi:hypothetical protein